MQEKNIYTNNFYEDQENGSKKSAEIVVPLMIDLIKPKSVIDVGCGVGTWLSVFYQHDITDILGVDGEYVNRNMLHIANNKFKSHDLKEPLLIDQNFDLCISLEVAEHLPSERAEIFIKSLVTLAPVVVFSAAIPFQGGDMHINEQWPHYWIDLFEKEGYIAIDCIREKVWENKLVEPWYKQNIFVFANKEKLSDYPLLKKAFKPRNEMMLSVVHPHFYLPKTEQITLKKRIINKIKSII